MNRTAVIVLSSFVWCALTAYLVFAVRLCTRERDDDTKLAELRVKVLDQNRLKVITPAIIEGWLRDEGYRPDSLPLGEVNTDRIRKLLLTQAFIKSARVYTAMNGTLSIEVTQRKPVTRINTYNGYNFYISDDNWILPIENGSPTYVPMITGNFAFPFGRDYFGSIEAISEKARKKSPDNYLYLLKLINFVRLTSTDDFWDAQFVQINLVSKGAALSGEGRWLEPEVELVPRIGRHIVLFGTVDDAQEKLDKLMLFYRKVLDYEGWDAYRTINLKYRGQVVCRR